MWGIAASKKDILLAICPPWGVEMPPLSLAYLSSFLRSKGIKTAVFDFNIKTYNDVNNKFRKYWENDYLQTWFEEQSFNETIFPFLKKHLKKAAKKILASRIAIIGFSVNQSNMMATLEVIQLIKKKNNSKKIILGGQVCQFPQMRKIILDYINYKDWTNMIDVYVIGEGEETLFEIVEAIKNGVDPAKILGTEIYKTWTQIENPKRSLIKDLDSLPFPTYEEFDLSSYKSDKLPILMSRGCTGKCVFCNDHVITGTYRYRSAEHVIRELRFHYDKGIKRFSCSDLLINGNLKELEKLCDLIIKENLDITFVGQAIVRPDMDDRLLAKMHKAGFHSLVFGVESLCDKTLKNMNKHFQLKDIEDLFPRLKKAQIKIFINLIVGFPGETEEDFNKTLENLKNLRPYIDKIMDLSPCEIKYLAPLEQNPDRYNYTLPRYYSEWHSKDGKNTPEVRQNGTKKVRSMAEELGIPIGG